jgi:hypothetical protein
MDKTPIHDPSMTPSAATTTSAANLLQPKAMIYVCGDCHKDNELKSTDVIRCKIKSIIIHFLFLLLLNRY